jgi:alpha,alpha-trehalase
VGLKNYEYVELANEIKQRWMKLNESVFKRTGKLMEKYNVVDLSLEAGGGEYNVQDGFGWTNGVYIAMKYDAGNQ